MRYIGAHVSAAGGVERAPLNAQAIGANAFALFTRNQRSWNTKPLSDKSIESFKANLKEVGIEARHVLPHDSYLINIGSPKAEIRQKSIIALKDEVARVEQLGLWGVNFHPGAHVNMVSEEECIAMIAEAMNMIIAESDHAQLVIENTAGQGSNLGYRFEHLAAMIDGVDRKERVGVCLDSCHLFASGYDIRTKEGWEATMLAFDRLVGMKYLRAMHLNDAKSEYSSRVDRHHNLGKGNIGLEAFRYILQDARLKDIPLILETPNEELWAEEIGILRKFAQDAEGGEL